MSLSEGNIAEIADVLESAHRGHYEVTKITDRYPETAIEDAYAIQLQVMRRKLARGEKVIGFKCGLTSYAKMRQMGVETPIFGFLTDSFAVKDGSEVEMSDFIHPKVEPEIAFLMKSPLQGPGCSIADVLAATDLVMPAIEVIDSRYRDFKFDLVSVIADNTSAARFMVGSKGTPGASLDLAALGAVRERNGKVQATGTGAAVVGHPAKAVAMLANHLAARGEEIPAGFIVLSGGITEAIPVEPGDTISVRVEGLESVSTRFV